MADQEDEGDVSDFDARIAAIAACVPARDRLLAAAGDDYARHLRAERRWQARRAALRLWAQVARCFALGR